MSSFFICTANSFIFIDESLKESLTIPINLSIDSPVSSFFEVSVANLMSDVMQIFSLNPNPDIHSFSVSASSSILGVLIVVMITYFTSPSFRIKNGGWQGRRHSRPWAEGELSFPYHPAINC